MMNPQPITPHLREQGFLEGSVLGLALFVLALSIVAAVFGGKNLRAQTNAPQATIPTQPQKAAAKFARPPSRAAAQSDAILTEPLPVPKQITELSSASSTPITPANRPPKSATVRWDRRGLEIEASNSSLDQILHQVAAYTGAKLNGLTQDQFVDQRVFGSYGPGPVCEVLSKLLDGSGYNVLMIGCRDADAPLEIVLSLRSNISSQNIADNHNSSNLKDSERLEPERQPEYPPAPPSSQANQDPFNIGGPPSDPQQFMQEILDRQHQIDQQQQNQNNLSH
jgi:hypothetical protein